MVEIGEIPIDQVTELINSGNRDQKAVAVHTLLGIGEEDRLTQFVKSIYE